MNKEPAFPTVEITHIAGQDVVSRQSGMTLRDYFAAKAMQSACVVLPDSVSEQVIAKRAYSMADAMLKARGE